MKKLFLMIAMVLIAFNMNAETRWGVTAGVNYNSVHFKQSDIFPTSMCLGGEVGVMGELMVPGVGFGVDAAILYSMRNGKLNMGAKKAWSSLGLGNEMCTLHYIDIPINLKFRYHNLDGLENTVMPMAFAGPVISVLLGHNKCGDALTYEKLSTSLQFGIGAELFQKVQVKIGYQFGIGETLRTKLLEENAAKNRTWFLNATYLF